MFEYFVKFVLWVRMIDFFNAKFTDRPNFGANDGFDRISDKIMIKGLVKQGFAVFWQVFVRCCFEEVWEERGELTEMHVDIWKGLN